MDVFIKSNNFFPNTKHTCTVFTGCLNRNGYDEDIDVNELEESKSSQTEREYQLDGCECKKPKLDSRRDVPAETNKSNEQAPNGQNVIPDCPVKAESGQPQCATTNKGASNQKEGEVSEKGNNAQGNGASRIWSVADMASLSQASANGQHGQNNTWQHGQPNTLQHGQPNTLQHGQANTFQHGQPYTLQHLNEFSTNERRNQLLQTIPAHAHLAITGSNMPIQGFSGLDLLQLAANQLGINNSTSVYGQLAQNSAGFPLQISIGQPNSANRAACENMYDQNILQYFNMINRAGHIQNEFTASSGTTRTPISP